MEKKQLEELYFKLISDPIFENIDLKSKDPNIFSILGIEHYEIRHSSFLAWLLDPNESHGLGQIFLAIFLKNILIDDRTGQISVLDIGSIDYSKVEIRREWKSIDILIITETFVVCVENKIWAGETGDQLIRYQEVVEQHFPNLGKCFVFLSPYGAESSENESYVNYSYLEIIDTLESIMNSRLKQSSSPVKVYINDYLNSLKRTIMSEEKHKGLAMQLYRNHREIFEYVWQNKPDEWNEFAEKLSAKIEKKDWILGSKNKGYVRFLTPNIKELILSYDTPNGWPKAESFLFEFDFYNGKELMLKTVVSPPKNHSAYDERIVEILSEIEGARESLGKSWRTHFIHRMDWNIRKRMIDYSEKDDKRIDRFIENNLDFIEKVENKLLEHREELLALKKEHEENSRLIRQSNNT